MQNLSTFKDYLLFHLLPNYCSGELKEGGGVNWRGAINGENTVIYFFSVLINTLFLMLNDTTFQPLFNTKNWYIFNNFLIIYTFMCAN